MAFLTVEFATTTNLPMLQTVFKGTGIDATAAGITVPHVPASTPRGAIAIAFRRVNQIAYPQWVRDITRITVTDKRSSAIAGVDGVVESFIARPEVARIKGWTLAEVDRRLRAIGFRGERLVFKRQPFWRERDIR